MTTTINDTLPDRLARYVKERKVTAYRLAQKLGISCTTAWNYMNKKQMPMRGMYREAVERLLQQEGF